LSPDVPSFHPHPGAPPTNCTLHPYELDPPRSLQQPKGELVTLECSQNVLSLPKTCADSQTRDFRRFSSVAKNIQRFRLRLGAEVVRNFLPAMIPENLETNDHHQEIPQTRLN
ncbi:hypothetical protein M758_9G023300, partial [Ceratodon purpureus]